MRVTLINQAFYPDVVSSGQHLTDLAVELAGRGHEVTVVTSRRAYDDPGRTFPQAEFWRGIRIFRVFNTGLGKRSKWTRALDFASFIVSCCLRLCLLPRQDLVVGMTSPPLVAVFAAWFARLRGGKFVYWVMDLNPDEAVAAGWLAPHSCAARWLERFSRFTFERAEKIIALDRFMQTHIAAKGVALDKIEIIPPWPHDADVNFDPSGRAEFRLTHGLQDKFVVMYSGNHSPCHPLDTLLRAARQLSGNPGIAFCFVGGGSGFAQVKEFAARERLKNIVCLPYQPLDRLAASLSAADLHTVVMGDRFVGLVHPCKVYNILRIGAPVLYIGPEPNHISELLGKINAGPAFASVRHGDADTIVKTVLHLSRNGSAQNLERRSALPEFLTQDALVHYLVSLLETVARNPGKSLVTPLAANQPAVPGH